MFLKGFLLAIVCVNHCYGGGPMISSAGQYQYLGVRHTNQMEAPSLETMGYGQSMKTDDDGADYGDAMGGGGGGDDGGQGGPRMRSLAAPTKGESGEDAGESDDVSPKKNCKWREIPRMRSLINPVKKCKGSGRMRSLDEPTVTQNIKMLERKKEEGECKVVRRVGLRPTDLKTMEKDLKPNRKETIETFTENYVVTSIKTITRTRRRIFMQKRKIVNQRMNRPIMIIRRKIIKERQVFERIVPKVIETREIIHKPSVQSKIIEGPIYEITMRPGRMRMLEPQPPAQDCPEVGYDPNNDSLESVDVEEVAGDQANHGNYQK